MFSWPIGLSEIRESLQNTSRKHIQYSIHPIKKHTDTNIQKYKTIFLVYFLYVSLNLLIGKYYEHDSRFSMVERSINNFFTMDYVPNIRHLISYYLALKKKIMGWTPPENRKRGRPRRT